MDTGRQWIRDLKTGRVFCVEPISERDQQASDTVFTNGGIDGTSVKKGFAKGGSITRDESIITPENGFKNIVEFHGSADSVIEDLLKKGV